MSEEWVRIAAPATTSNIGPGFDTFGLAMSEPCDIIEGRKIESGLVISEITGPGSKKLPTEPKINSVTIAADQVLKRCNADFGIEIKIKKGIRPCSGMGSSGASAAGGAFLANIMCGEKLSPTEVILCAAHAESVISGGLHADNVSPCILGGFTVIRSYAPLEVFRIEPPKNLGMVVALPDIMVATADARKVVPQEVPLRDFVFHIGNASSLVYGMMTGDLGVIGRSIKDVVIEPSRAKLVPFLKEAEKEALTNGAIASFLGGSGPCIMSFYDANANIGNIIAEKVKAVYTDNKIGCDTWITKPGAGCKRI
jgi:homoserine kinase